MIDCSRCRSVCWRLSYFFEAQISGRTSPGFLTVGLCQAGMHKSHYATFDELKR